MEDQENLVNIKKNDDADDESNTKRSAVESADDTARGKKRKTSKSDEVIVISSDSDDEEEINSNDPTERQLSAIDKRDQLREACKFTSDGAALYDQEKYEKAMKMYRKALGTRNPWQSS
ncbi:unnamed protein product [Cylindrotheca closterium]|uniref:Uncharacterized protein n=1 Tax=Cylindrotheca closterium TaxID=2856 RepID=A0AAD2CE71_9STRA|nr:unnamed protein product [Cylindrotheca closterium]